MGLTSREKRESFMYPAMEKFFFHSPLYVQVLDTLKDALGKYQNEVTLLIMEKFINDKNTTPVKPDRTLSSPKRQHTNAHHNKSAKKCPPIQSGL